MSRIPEFILQTSIVRGINALRKDTTLIDQLFRNLSQAHLQQMRDFVVGQSIDLCINYPRKTLAVPAIVILLRNETEAEAYLGDSMGYDSNPEVFEYEGGIENEILGGAGSLEEVTVRRSTVYGPCRVFSATNNTIKVEDTVAWNGNQYEGGNFSVHVVGGLGVGQVRDIATNSGNVLMVSANWEVNPDVTSIFEIREKGEETVGEPSSLYDRKRPPVGLERRGSLYQYTYQIQVVGKNPESTIYLYMILKALFTLQRTFLETQGLINMQMGGTDFVNRAEYMPDFSYMRAMNMTFMVPFDVFEIEQGLVTHFQLVVEQCTDPAKTVAFTSPLISLEPDDPTICG